ncbi:MAG: hypothetical protein PHE52_00540 [Candidatus Pacebacteria bacterium]|nr:hypothetical protein [Candidatus Paceibacterota bacterium]
MTAYPKSKTIKKGLRPITQDEIAPALREPAQKIKKWVERVLGDNQPLTGKDLYLITRVKVAAERLLAPTEAEKNEILLKLNRLEDEGYHLKFDKEDIWGANAAAILIRKEGRLTEFINQTRDKLKEIK